MKTFEEMTEEEQMEFVCSLERNDGGDPFIKTPTLEIFECAVKCMGWDTAEQFLEEFAVTFEELKDNWWLVCGTDHQRLYIE